MLESTLGMIIYIMLLVILIALLGFMIIIIPILGFKFIKNLIKFRL
jgi:hypothetical protein